MMDDTVLHMEVINLEACPGDMRFRHRFGPRGGTLGSAAGDQWRLPGGGVAPSHARILQVEGRFCLMDCCGRTYINGAESPLGSGHRAVLRDGDEIRIGPFRLRVGERAGLGGAESGWCADQWLQGVESEPLKHHRSAPSDNASELLNTLLTEPTLDPLAGDEGTAAMRHEPAAGTAPSVDQRSAMVMPRIRKQEKQE